MCESRQYARALIKARRTTAARWTAVASRMGIAKPSTRRSGNRMSSYSDFIESRRVFSARAGTRRGIERRSGARERDRSVGGSSCTQIRPKTPSLEHARHQAADALASRARRGDRRRAYHDLIPTIMARTRPEHGDFERVESRGGTTERCGISRDIQVMRKRGGPGHISALYSLQHRGKNLRVVS